MINFSPIFYVTGVLLTTLSLTMFIPAMVDLHMHNADWKAFVTSAFFTAFVGVALILINRSDSKELTLKQAFVLTVTSWVALTMFAALPFRFADLRLSYTDAFFESMSGLTTTGATVMTGLDTAPPGILLWRAVLQWLGGIGIIVVAMAVLPMLKIGGMQLFRTESSDKSEKILPRAGQIASAIGGVYTLLTVICVIALWYVGMTPFDAICHAMTTIATGGFSTHDLSVGYFDNLKIEITMMIFMLAGSLPFVLYIQVLRGRPLALWKDSQVRWFLSIVGGCVVILTVWLVVQGHDPGAALRNASFHVVSIITTSGFATTDYYLWGSFSVIFFFLITVTGGCTGSTTGGIKIFRYQVLFEIAKSQVNRLIQPHGVFMPQFNRKPINETVTSSVLSFFILFAFCFSVLAVLLSLTGLDYITSMSSAATVIANVGPALGDVVGPAGNYSSLSDTAKWLLSFGMLLGRLELFTLLILLSPYFWKQ